MGVTSGRGRGNRACAGPAPARVSNTSGGEWARHRIKQPRDGSPCVDPLLVNSRTARRLLNTNARRRRRRRVGARCPSEARSTAATPQRAVGSGTGTTGSALPEGAAHLWALFSRRRAGSVDAQESRPWGLGLGVSRLSTRAAPAHVGTAPVAATGPAAAAPVPSRRAASTLSLAQSQSAATRYGFLGPGILTFS